MPIYSSYAPTPRTEEEINFCIKIQEQDSWKIQARQMLRRALKRLKKLNPNSEEGEKVMNEVEMCNEALASVNEVIRYYGQCPVFNCAKHPAVMNADTRSEVDASSCTDMDTTSLADDQEQATMRRKYKR
ncbi:hypothetical protein AVEN_148414-1 [Araneus ventricosus]|uniref:Uncharacterized protein n=1 Tax=Araneus ventricosus TaxID=182803 RepID=A0A4Y2WBM6_ARAVE|nr:hypothetical protein AVEN_148414-1 [Araneus ventricosus]